MIAKYDAPKVEAHTGIAHSVRTVKAVFKSAPQSGHKNDGALKPMCFQYDVPTCRCKLGTAWTLRQMLAFLIVSGQFSFAMATLQAC